MARIAGVDLPRAKRVEIALTYIYGIGVSRSNKILGKAGIDPSVRVKDLSEEEASRIAKIIDQRRAVVANGSSQVVKIPVARTPVRLVLSFPRTIPRSPSDPRDLGAQVNFRFVPAKP